MGTLDYISPEQIEGQPVDGRADQYALACAAFEMLTGAPPFRREEATAVIYAHLSDPPPPLTSRRPDLPPAADQVLARALGQAARGPLPELPGVRGRPARRVRSRPYDAGPQPSPAGRSSRPDVRGPSGRPRAAAQPRAAGTAQPRAGQPRASGPRGSPEPVSPAEAALSLGHAPHDFGQAPPRAAPTTREPPGVPRAAGRGRGATSSPPSRD